MINLQNFFDGLFINKNITHTRLVAFALDNVRNMSIPANNPGGIYDDEISATQAAADNLSTFLTTKTGDKGSRKGGTSAKDLARTNVEVYVANRKGWARALLGGKTDPRFIATFPAPLSAMIYNPSDDVFDTNIQALIAKAHLYATQLPGFETDLTTLYNTFHTADNTHGSQTSAVRTDIVTVDTAAEALDDQLTDNVLMIAHNNRRSQTAAYVYFNVTLLYPEHRLERKKGEPAGRSTTDIPIDYFAGKRTHFHNKGATTLKIGMKLQGLPVGTIFTVAPDGRINKEFSEYFSNGDNLYIVNEDNVPGMYQLDIVS